MLKSKNESTYQPNSEIFHLNPKPEVLQQNDEISSVGLNNDPFFLNCLLREGKRIFNQEKEEPVDKSMFSKSESHDEIHTTLKFTTGRKFQFPVSL